MPSARLVGWGATWLFAVAAVSWAQPALKDVDAWTKEGLWHHDAGEYEKAIAAFRAGLEIEPGNLTLIYELSNSLHSAGRFDDCAANARPHLGRAGGLAPAFYALVASCLDSGGDPVGAAALFDEALAKFPDDGVLLFNGGVTQLRLLEPRRAAELLERAVEARPRHPSSHYWLGRAYQEAGHRTPALLALLRFAALAPDDGRAADVARRLLDLLGEGFRKTGETEFSIEIPEKTSLDAGDYRLADLMLTLSAAAVTADEWEGKSEGAKLVYRLDALLGHLEEEKAPRKPDFCRRTYLPFTRELRRAGHLEAFTHQLFAPAGVAGVADWLRANPAKVETLRRFLALEGAV